MRKTISFALVTTATFLLVACASMPKEEDLQQMNRAQVSELLPGKTLTRRTDYGRWAQYMKDGSTGVGRASGSWGKEEAPFEYTINPDGEVCSTFMGEHEWSKPTQKFCSVFFTDQAGAYYTRVTEDTWKPKRVGNFRKFEIIAGDKYELANN